jgi:hypothetical protein
VQLARHLAVALPRGAVGHDLALGEHGDELAQRSPLDARPEGLG